MYFLNTLFLLLILTYGIPQSAGSDTAFDFIAAAQIKMALDLILHRF